MDLKPKHASSLQGHLPTQMWEQARHGREATLRPSSERNKCLDLSSTAHHAAMTAISSKDPSHHKTSTSHGQTGVVVIFMLQVRCPIWPTEFIGDLVLGKCCPFEGGGVGQLMRWQTECVMMVVFRSWSLAVQILVRERLEALREGPVVKVSIR